MTFDGDVRRIIKKHKSHVVDKFNYALNGVYSSVIKLTPVDQGWLKGDWQVSVKAPALSSAKRKDPSGTQATAEIPNGHMKKFEEHTAFLTNNLPYAYRVEYEGWSHTKAPNGMVRKSARRFSKYFEMK